MGKLGRVPPECLAVPLERGDGAIAPYDILRELHAGNQSTSYLAEDRSGHTRVTLKIATAGFENQLADEFARIQALRSDRILRPFHLGANYYAAPYLEGSTLAQQLAAGAPLDAEALIHLATQLLEAVDDVHAGGYLQDHIHPGNLLLAGGQWYLLNFDFGPLDLQAGHLEYCAPERRGTLDGPVTASSDLFSVARVLETAGARQAFPLWEEFLERLGAREPMARYQTALGALSDFQAIKQADLPVVLGTTEATARLARPSMCGRQQELAHLLREHELAEIGPSRVLWLQAEPGLGKTALAQAFRRTLMARGSNVLWATLTSERTLFPVTQWAAGLLEIAPQLRDLPQADPFSNHELPALPLLNEQFFQLVDQLQSPIVLVVDDSHRAAEQVKAFARDFLTLRERGLLMCLSRSCDLPSDLVLSALDQEPTEQALLSMAGALPDKLSSRIAQWSRGNPLLAQGALRGLIESGRVLCHDGLWRIDSDGPLKLGRREAVLIKQRIADLPDDEAEVLKLVAVLGTDATIETLSRALGGPPPLRTLIARHLLQEQEGSISFTHDQLHEHALKLLTVPEKRRCHCLAAESVTSALSKAVHWHAAGLPHLALPAAREASEIGRRQGSYVDTATAIEIEIDTSASQLKDEDLAGLHMELSMLYEITGRLEKADEHHLLAQSLTQSKETKAWLCLRKASRDFMHRGDRSGLDSVHEALRLTNQAVPQSSALWLSLLKELWDLAVWMARPRFEAGSDESKHLIPEILKMGAHIQAMDTSVAHTSWYFLRLINVSRHTGYRSGLLWALDNLAAGLSHGGLNNLAERLLRLSASLQGSKPDDQILSVHLSRKGFVQMAQGRVAEAIDTLERSRASMRRAGHGWEMHVSEHLIGAVYALTGQHDLAVKAVRYSLTESLRQRDCMHYWANLELLAYTARPCPPIDKDWIPGIAVGLTVMHSALGLMAQQEGNLIEAAARHWQAAKGMAPAWRLALVGGRSATAFRRLLTKLPPQAERLRRSLFKEYERGLRRARSDAKKFVIAKPQALREKAWLHIFEGRYTLAQDTFEHSIECARGLGLHYELWHSLGEALRAADALGWKSGNWRKEWDVLSIKLGLSRQQRPAPHRSLHLLTQLERILEHGRSIALSLNPQQLFHSITQAVQAIFDHPSLGLYTIEGECLAGRHPTPSRSLIRKLLESGEAILVGAYSFEDDTETSQFGNSTLCAPIKVRGDIKALLWISHENVEGLFGEKELALADYLSVLCSTAWENIQRFELLQASRQELEAAAARKQAFFQLSGSANAELSAEGALLKTNEAWQSLELSLDWWQHQTDAIVTLANRPHHLTRAPLADGGELLSATPLPTSESHASHRRQVERLQHLQRQVHARALEPLGRLLDMLDEGAELEEASHLARLAIDSVSELIVELSPLADRSYKNDRPVYTIGRGETGAG